MSDAATRALHSVICPWCGCEPDAVAYWRRKSDKVRVGYTCSCGARVISGQVIGVNIG